MGSFSSPPPFLIFGRDLCSSQQTPSVWLVFVCVGLSLIMAAHTSKQDWGYVPQHWQLINGDKIGKMVPLLLATINTHSPSAGAGHGSLSFPLEELMTAPVLCMQIITFAAMSSWMQKSCHGKKTLFHSISSCPLVLSFLPGNLLPHSLSPCGACYSFPT